MHNFVRDILESEDFGTVSAPVTTLHAFWASATLNFYKNTEEGFLYGIIILYYGINERKIG